MLIRADLHTHAVGDGRFGPSTADLVAALVDAAVDVGLDCLAVTDHDDLRPGLLAEEYAAARGLPILVVPGMEVTTEGGHLVALGVRTPIPGWQPLAETIAQIRAAGAISLLPHPFFDHLRRRTDVDAIERFNSRYGDFEVAGAPVAIVASSDAHGAADLRGSAHHTLIDGVALRWSAVADAVRAGRTTAV